MSDALHKVYSLPMCFQTIMFHDRVCLSSLIAPPGIHPRIPERCEHRPDVNYSVTISFLHSNLVVGSHVK